MTNRILSLAFAVGSGLAAMALIMICGHETPAVGQDSNRYRLMGNVTRTDGTAAVGEIVYLFPRSDGKCGYGLGSASDGKFYPRNPQSKTDGKGRFVLEFSKADLEGAIEFCVGMLVRGSGSVDIALFSSGAATWVQPIASLENDRELDLAKIPLKMVADGASFFGLKPR